MSTLTKNYNFVKPELTDVADITATNENWDKVDENLLDLNEKVDEQVDELKQADAQMEEQHQQLELSAAKQSTTINRNQLAYAIDTPNDYGPGFVEVTKLGGMSYKTKNLIPFQSGQTVTQNGVTLTVNANGSITINGTATGDLWVPFNAVYLDIGKQYTFYAKNCPNDILACYLYTDSDTWVVRDSPIIKAASQERYIFVVGGGAGSTFNNLTIYPMLNAGSTALPYEQYFSGLRDTKVTEIKSIGANLAKPRKDMEVWGCSITSIDDAGKYTLTSTNSYNAIYARIARVTLFAGVTYTLSLANATGSLTNLVVWETGTTRDLIDTTNKSATITPLVTAEYDIAVYMASGYSISVGSTASFYLMLNKGASALAYEPYKEFVTTIPAAVQALDGYGRGVNDTCCNYIDWEKKTWNKTVEKIVFKGDGVENWTATPTSNGYRFSYSFDVGARALFIENNEKSPVLCSHYEAVSVTNTYTDVNGVAVNGPSLYVKDSNYNTANDWKAYLATQYEAGTPVTLVYALENPIVIDISDILSSSNILKTDRVGAIVFENQYEKDVPVYATFYGKINEAVGSRKFIGHFIGDLDGTAARAQVAMDVPDWAKSSNPPTKPSGSYTGTGSSTKRTINLDETGFVCMISGYGYMALVTNYGAIVKKGDNTTITALTYDDITYNKGVLTISTGSEYVNAHGHEYYYQVL